MKKVMAILMALVLLLGCSAAYAQTPNVKEKFWGQAELNAVKGTVSFAVNGERMEWLADDIFQRMKDVLPGLEIGFGHSLYQRQYTGGYVEFPDGDGGNNTIHYAYDDQVIALGGDAVSDDDTWYLLENDLSKIAALFSTSKENALPGIQEILRAMDEMDDSWKMNAAERLSVYETALSIWMNQYAAMGINGEGQSELSCAIPIDAVKSEIKGLLSMLYDDEETLQVLSYVLEPIGAGIYLNPAMESAFCMLVDQLAFQGEVKVVRRYDEKGQLVLDRLSLPLPPFGDWQGVEVEVTGKGDVAFTLTGREQQKVSFTATANQNGYAGVIQVDAVRDGGQKHWGFEYTASWQEMEETYSLQTDKLEMLQQGILTLKPDEQTTLPAQSITLDVAYSCNSEPRSATNVKVDLVWKDMGTDASLAVMVQGKTASPFQVEDVNGLGKTVYFTNLPAEQRQSLMGNILLAPFGALMQ